jgi:phage baseplate assembly protein W
MKARYRAWRFLHPDLDVPEMVAGLQISPSGGVDMVDGNRSVRQALLLLLSTRPGERVMRPRYGCYLHRLVFSPNDAATAGLAIHYVRRAIERWEPRVEILALDAGQNPERPELLDVFLEYRVRATQHVEQLAFSVNLIEGEM